MAEKTAENNIVSRFTGIDSILTIAGALLIILGSFLAWASVSVLFVSVSASGMDGDGKFTLIAGVALIVLAVLQKTVWSKNVKTNKVLPWVFLGLAAIALAVVVYDAAQFVGLSSSFAKINIGVGMYIIAIGSLAVIINTLKPVFKLKKNLTYIVAVVLVVAFAGVAVLGHQAKEGSGWDFGFDSSLDDSGSSLLDSFSNLNTDTSVNEDSDSSNNKSVPTVEVVSKTIQQALSYYTDTSYVVGEISNTSGTDAYIQDVTASLYLDGTVVASGTSSYTPTMLKNGETAPYKAMITSVPNYDEIKVTVSTKTSAQAYQKCTYFDITSSTPRDGGYGSLLVAGEVNNNTNKNYSYGNIYAWILDSDNKVLDVTTSYIKEIDAGASSVFEANFYFSETIPAYDDIKIIAESCY